nr:aminotransferase class V-fold PLP-dependent enzyme [Clostridia bacterium]
MIYLDNAATSSPKPQCVIDAVAYAMTKANANPGRSGHSLSLEAGRTVLNCRENIARLINADDPFSISMQFNCTDALNLAIKGCLRRGDHVISTLMEHNSVLRVLMELQRRGDISVTLLRPQDDGMVDPEEIRRRIRPDTRLIICTHASNVTGAIQPVAAIGALAQEHGITYLIDGAQALGAMPVDIKKLSCDMYAFPGHKGLLGPQGTGGLYVRPGLVLQPLRQGGTGSSSESMLQPEELPERYESGTLGYHGIAGLNAGALYISEHLHDIYMHERELTTALYEDLASIPGVTVYSPAQESARAGIVSFNAGDMSSSQVADILDSKSIAVRGGLHCAPGAHSYLGTLRRGVVRASVGHATTFEEIEQFISVIREVCRLNA